MLRRHDVRVRNGDGHGNGHRNGHGDGHDGRGHGTGYGNGHVDDVGGSQAPPAYRTLLPRAQLDVDAVIDTARDLCEAVRMHGHPELARQAAAYDGVDIADVRVPLEAIREAGHALDPEVRRAVQTSIARLQQTARREVPQQATTHLGRGAVVTQRQVPIGRVGLYVPAAKAPLISSVVMNVVPAQVAGVGSLALASPPQKDNDGLPHPAILGACDMLGVDEVYAVGGAGAVAMFAYGYAEPSGSRCEPVDLVTGPMNVYGVAAKRLLRGVVGIDAEAGPTEIAVLADNTADPRLVAADLVSQAEHDPLAASVLVTDSEQLADAVDEELTRQVAQTKHRERVVAALTGTQSGIVLVDDLDQGLEVVDAYAAEHLEIHTRDAAGRASRVRNAGAVFVGPAAPVSLGDYCAGSNHVLPTGGSAHHASGLSVRSFFKTMQVVEYDQDALDGVADDVCRLADAEDLPAHGAAVRIRQAP